MCRLKYELDQRISSEHQVNSELKKLRIEIDDLQREKGFLEKELSKSRVGGSNGSTEEVAGLKNELASFKMKYERVCNEITQLETAKVNLEVQLRRMEEKVQGNATPREDLKNLNAALEGKSVEVEKLSGLVEGKNAEIKVLREELRGLRGEIQVGNEDVGVLRREIEANKNVIEKQTNDYKRLKEEYGKVVEEIKRANDGDKKWERECGKVRASYEEKANEVVRLKGVVEEKEREVGFKGKEVGKLQERLDRYKAQQDKYEKQMSKMEHEMMQLTGERDELVAQLEKSQELLVQFQKELNSRVQNSEEDKHEVRWIWEVIVVELLLMSFFARWLGCEPKFKSWMGRCRG